MLHIRDQHVFIWRNATYFKKKLAATNDEELQKEAPHCCTSAFNLGKSRTQWVPRDISLTYLINPIDMFKIVLSMMITGLFEYVWFKLDTSVFLVTYSNHKQSD